MASKQAYKPTPVREGIRQSLPIDLKEPFSDSWLKGKTAIITGGGSGFGAGCVRRWAAAGASVIIADISVGAGTKVAAETRDSTGNQNVHFVHCDVTDWMSQVGLFKEAARLSPHGGIDIVVANAGIAAADGFETPKGLDSAEPPKPNFKTMEVNMTGLLYTAHLALFWLPKNPESRDADSAKHPAKQVRDRCLLLMGSTASLAPFPAQALYNASKHGVLGLFRSLRGVTMALHGVRVNLICPWFIDTPILPAAARIPIAGEPIGKAEDVVEAMTRLAADSRIIGRSLYVGPKMRAKQDEPGQLDLSSDPRDESAIFEPFAEDFEDAENFVKNLVRLLNILTIARGYSGWLYDIGKALTMALKTPLELFGRKQAR